jgi:hypothetical protein
MQCPLFFQLLWGKKGEARIGQTGDVAKMVEYQLCQHKA